MKTIRQILLGISLATTTVRCVPITLKSTIDTAADSIPFKSEQLHSATIINILNDGEEAPEIPVPFKTDTIKALSDLNSKVEFSEFAQLAKELEKLSIPIQFKLIKLRAYPKIN